MGYALRVLDALKAPLASPALTGSPTVGGAAIPTSAGSQTFTNKRITPRVSPITSSATPAINTDTCDVANLLTLAANVTSFTTSLTGTPTDGQKLLLRIKSTSAQTLAWGTAWQSSGAATLPTASVAGKTITLGFAYDAAAAKWTLLAIDATGY